MAIRPTRAHVPNRTRPGRVQGARSRPVDTNAASFKEFLDLLHFKNYFLSFEAYSEILCEVTRVPRLRMIPEHLTSESSPSIWTRSDLRVDPEHLDLGSSQALGPRSLSRAPRDAVSFPNTWTQNIPKLISLSEYFKVFICNIFDLVKEDLRTCRVVIH